MADRVAPAASHQSARESMPSKRAAKRQKGAPVPEVHVETLLARCDRGDLELLLAHHVRGGSVPLDDVLALLFPAPSLCRLQPPLHS